MNSFGQRLMMAIRSKQTPLMVGLDPRFDRLPEVIRKSVDPNVSEQVADAFERFCIEIIEVVAEQVAVVKPQFAFFEQLGPAGMKALKNVIAFANQKDLIVVGDAKRGDIGSTAEAYAEAYLNPGGAGIACDALTVNPYMGVDTLTPFVDVAMQNGCGIFVLVKTSNPGSGRFQDVESDRGTLFESVADAVQELSATSCDSADYGAVGAVVGATYPDQLKSLRQRMPNVPILIPGFGAQGGTALDIAGGFDSEGLGAVVNSSRGIIFAYENEKWADLADWRDAVSQATRESISTIRSAIKIK